VKNKQVRTSVLKVTLGESTTFTRNGCYGFLDKIVTTLTRRLWIVLTLAIGYGYYG